ncbi:MAG: hypothetical protein HKO66_02330 [Saprospiraceae bacterium]|nr:peptidoglycan-binding protein [Bacteroidia bacterium]NNE13349.1 hypothetical protein [Saprospiraceae bacterium]NNL91050.1 hypothetical protein [Saprospiraceae bacterium]
MIINKTSPSSIIEAWQKFLNKENISVGTPDGIWGPNTEAATKEFQSSNKLTADGIAGPNTISTASKKGFSMPEAKEFSPVGHTNAIVDISHLNPKIDFNNAKSAGITAVFHKATQSAGKTAFRDKAYPKRHLQAKEAGLLWGAYHFGVAGSGSDQADAFLNYTKPDNDTLLVLDFERATTKGETTMQVEEAEAFINVIKTKTGKYPGIYGGSLLKEVSKGLSNSNLLDCWLWIAQYSSEPKLPNGWSDYTIWQFTDGTTGNGALPVDGIGRCDRDLFKGSKDGLISFWKKHSV